MNLDASDNKPAGQTPKSATTHAIGPSVRGPEFAVVRFYRFVLAGVAVGCALQCLLMLVARLGPTVELASHFSMHSLVLLSIVCPVLLLLKMRRVLWPSFIAWGILAWVVQPWGLIPQAAQSTEAFPNSVSVMSWNVLSVNKSFSQVDEIIQQNDPDILILIEVRPGFLDALKSLSGYQARIEQASWRGGGIAVLTKSAGVELELLEFDYPTQPAAVISLQQNDHKMKLLAMHTFSPMPISRTEHRDRQLASVIDWSDKQNVPTCVAGDLNITPWAPMFGSLLRSGFRDSRKGSGNCASWPAPLKAVGIPIDHALTKGECLITERTVITSGPGSDHRPIRFKLHY